MTMINMISLAHVTGFMMGKHGEEDIINMTIIMVWMIMMIMENGFERPFF